MWSSLVFYSCCFIFWINEYSIFLISSISESNFLELLLSIKVSSVAAWIKYSSSCAEPEEIYKNLISSFCVSRPQPSTIFVGIESAALLIYETKLNCSLIGKLGVILYTSITNRWDFCQTI